ncbi:MAG TPA: hypothetical protein VK975_02045 [Acidimicrobiales bacterium]|nr:hypothetical protein [Acidimicrobiales bacterium]
MFRANLRPVPHDPESDAGSDVMGKAKLVLRGNELRTVLNGRDLSPGLPHAMHIHGELEAENECPSLDADENDDGLIDTLEGQPAYGPIDISLTTEGGTSAEFVDALALDRFPVADDSGDLHYNRRFTIPEKFAESLDELHIVVHGQDLNRNGEYDFEAGESSLSEAVGSPVPLEAELPVACGTIEAR